MGAGYTRARDRYASVDMTRAQTDDRRETLPAFADPGDPAEPDRHREPGYSDPFVACGECGLPALKMDDESWCPACAEPLDADPR